MSLYRETRKCEQDRLKDVHVEVHGKRAGCYKMLKPEIWNISLQKTSVNRDFFVFYDLLTNQNGAFSRHAV